MSKKQNVGSTQKFTEIKNIVDDIVIFQNNTACLIIEVQASNFALLSQQEQNTKLYSYAALLNSLSFSVQIIVRNKKIDLTSYLNYLDQEAQKLASMDSMQSSESGMKQIQGENLAAYVKLYKSFIEELITVNSVLDKKFYLVIYYSPLEKGVTGAGTALKKETGEKDANVASAKATLHTKADTMHSQIARIGLRSKTLREDELVRLFYDIYNQTQTAPNEFAKGIKTPIVTGQEQ